MNPEQFIKNQVIAGFDESAEVLEIANETISNYRKGIFDCIPTLIKDMRRKLGMKVLLKDWITVKEFSEKMNIPNSTAWSWLNKEFEGMNIDKNNEKRPFKYKAI